MLTIDVGAKQLRVTVEDGSFFLPTPQHASGLLVEGRGLELVDSLASSWGYQRTDRGKCVGFEPETRVLGLSQPLNESPARSSGGRGPNSPLTRPRARRERSHPPLTTRRCLASMMVRRPPRALSRAGWRARPIACSRRLKTPRSAVLGGPSSDTLGHADGAVPNLLRDSQILGRSNDKRRCIHVEPPRRKRLQQRAFSSPSAIRTCAWRSAAS